MELTLLSQLIDAQVQRLYFLGGNERERDIHDHVVAQEHQIHSLNNEAMDLRQKIQVVQDNQSTLQNNKQFKETQEGYEQQIQILESDKVSLMKRLNMVLSELERATQEKSEINARLLEQDRMADELKRKLDEVAQLKNVVNRNLQEDLRYEKELNDKLRAELERFEHEKSLLLKRLQEQESLATEIQRETGHIQNNLRKRSDDLQRLQNDHEQNLVQLRDLNSQLDLLRGQEMQNKSEKRRMEDELDHLTRDRNDLIQRMNELRDRYDEYVFTMNKEREEIMQQNRSHIKLLTAKLFFQLLSEGLHWRKKVAFSSIIETSNQMHQHTNRIVRFTRIFSRYIDENKRHYLRLWYRNALNFQHENFKLQGLIDMNSQKKQKTIFFLKWRQAFLRNRAAFEHKLQSCKLINSLTRRKQDSQLRRYVCQWRDFCDLRQLQFESMLSVSTRHHHRSVRNSFVRWLAHCKKGQLQDKCDNMGRLITGMWFKQRVFLALKQACLESRIENQTGKFNSWRKQCEQKRKDKYLERKCQMVDRISDTRTEQLLQKVFDAFRFNSVNQKYEATKEKLEQEIPLREELEHKRDEMVKINRTKEKFRLFRRMCIRYSDVKYRALMVWKENNEYHKHTMQRIKLRLINEHKRRVSKAFFRWKAGADKKQMVQMVVETEELINENQNLTNTLEVTIEEKKQLADCTGRAQVNKLDRLRNMLDRNTCRARFHQWANVACFMADLENGLFLTSKTMKRRKMKNGFMKFRQQVKEQKRQKHVMHKCMWMDSVRDRKVTEFAWDQWKQDHQRQLKAKAFLRRSIKGVDKLIENDFFCVWKKMMFDARKKVYTDNIEELQKRQNDHQQQIGSLVKQIEINEADSMHLQSKMSTQAHKIMANFITRFIYSSQARGFYTWQEELKEHKQKKRFLRSTILFWTKKKQAQGFRSWAEWTLKDKEHELNNKLKQKEEERRVTQELKDTENIQQEQEIQQLNVEHQEASMIREQLEQNFDKALTTHIQRKANNQYIDKRLNILLMWKDVNQRERNAVNVIGAIARQTLRKEVFQRIRQQARDNALEADAEKKQWTLFRLIKATNLRGAFGKWRALNFTRTREEMELKSKLLVETKERQEEEFQMMQQRKMDKAERIIRQRRQREVATQWIIVARNLKQLKVKDDVLRQNIQYQKQKTALQKWYQRVQCTLYLKRKDQAVITKYKQMEQRRIFQEWLKTFRISKALCTRTVKFIKRMQHLEAASAFTQLVHFQKSYEERTRERKEYGSQMIGKMLSRLLKHKLSDTLLNLKNRAHKRDFKEKFLHRCFKHAVTGRQRFFFQKWKHNSDRQTLADVVNTEGDVVLERNQIMNNVKVLRKFLIDQGYEGKKLDDYLAHKEQQQRANMKKAVTSFFFKASDFAIVPKAMNQWKRWIEQRRLYKNRCQFVRNALNNPTFWAFRKWKDHDKHAVKRLRHLTKQDLIEKIITDDMAIGSAKSRLGRMDEAIDHLQIQRDNLVQHFIGGQKLALALARNNHEKALMKGFLRWKKITLEDEQDRLGEQLDRTNSMIQDLAGHVNKLEGINMNLTQENEELRQAALDGIEIAKAVQELTREREGLSDDLQGRSNTIKKLIADNNELSLRLSIAQKEAEQLEQLNNQSFIAPPDREY